MKRSKIASLVIFAVLVFTGCEEKTANIELPLCVEESSSESEEINIVIVE